MFEPEAAVMQNAYKRRLEEFAGPRQIGAREAYEAALPLVQGWLKMRV